MTIERIDCVAISMIAGDISKSANVAYWVHFTGDFDYHVKEAEAKLKQLATLMGYKVEPILDEAATL